MKVVKFANGKYGVKRRHWSNLWMTQFLDEDGQYWWNTPSKVLRYCMMETCMDAIAAMKTAKLEHTTIEDTGI